MILQKISMVTAPVGESKDRDNTAASSADGPRNASPSPRVRAGFSTGTGSLNTTINTVARVTLKCSAILDDARSDCLMVLTQERH